MPQVIHETKSKRRGRGAVIAVSVGICFIGVLVVGAGIYFSMQLREREAKQRYDLANKQVTNLVAKNQGALAVTTARSYLSTSPPAPYKGKGEVLLGMALMQVGSYTDAEIAYKAAEADGQGGTLADVQAIAESARLAGDKATALDYYQKMLVLMNNDDVVHRAANSSEVQLKIKALEAGN